ncbi:MAG: hypothetical protein OYK82_01200 [Gammaproteobacteria bacterium]|nr:hypothetical protein [Gammaproteobacteria bacterium]
MKTCRIAAFRSVASLASLAAQAPARSVVEEAVLTLESGGNVTYPTILRIHAPPVSR